MAVTSGTQTLGPMALVLTLALPLTGCAVLGNLTYPLGVTCSYLQVGFIYVTIICKVLRIVSEIE